MWLFACLLSSAPVHATWVYKREGLSEARMRTLLDGRKELALTELYVSVDALPPDAAETPAKLKRLKSAGYRVEALVDGPSPDGWIRRIVAYNEAQTDPTARFDGVHYDYEPWIGTGASTAWVERSTSAYERVRLRLAHSALPLGVDVSGAKLHSLSDADQRALFKAAPRVVIMQYEAPRERVGKRCDAVLRRAPERRVPSMLIVALRVKDFGCAIKDELDRIDKSYQDTEGYAGWALFEYEDYLAACRRPAKTD